MPIPIIIAIILALLLVMSLATPVVIKAKNVNKATRFVQENRLCVTETIKINAELALLLSRNQNARVYIYSKDACFVDCKFEHFTDHDTNRTINYCVGIKSGARKLGVIGGATNKTISIENYKAHLTKAGIVHMVDDIGINIYYRYTDSSIEECICHC